MMINEKQKNGIVALISTKKGTLKRNIPYVHLVLSRLLDGELTNPTHVGMDFSPTFYQVIEILELELIEHGDKAEYLSMATHDYAISLRRPPFSYKELLDLCSISYEEKQLN